MPPATADAAKVVKIFGERNTGTRAVAAMLRDVPEVTTRLGHPRVRTDDSARTEAAIEASMHGHWKRLYLHALRDEREARRAAFDPWKHAAPRLTPAMRRARVRTLIMVRDPYSWLLALARRPYHLKGPASDSLEAFAARPWLSERREGVAAVLPSPIDLWVAKVRASLAYRDEAARAGLRCEILRFEDFIAGPEAALGGALTALGLSPEGLRRRETNTKAGEADLAALQTYYRARTWQTRFSAETVMRVNAAMDWSVAAALGYRPLDPGAFPDTLPEAVTARTRSEMTRLSEPSHRETCTATAA